MGKNYMPEVARMLGVEIGEEFDILNKERKKIAYGPYKITDNTIVDCDGENPQLWWDFILNGEYTIQKRPWRPKDSEAFWLVRIDGNVICSRFYKNNESDLGMLNMGNCFPTEEAAEAAVPEMLAKFEEIKKGVRE